MNKNYIYIFFLQLFILFLHFSTFFPDFLTPLFSVPFFLFIPGYLTFSLLVYKEKTTSAFETICFSVGLSVLLLTLLGLGINTLLPFFGISGPLQFTYVVLSSNLLICILLGLLIIFKKPLPIKLSMGKTSFPNVILWIFCLLLPLVSVFGTFRLNNGGDNSLLFISLFIYLSLIFFIYFFKSKLSDNSLALFIYSLAISLLLMVGLRSSFPIGHDIRKETELFLQTLNVGFWEHGISRDAYTTCLSITILPTVLTFLTKISPYFIYKFLFQAIFAFVPVITFSLVKRFSDSYIGLLSALGFIIFPTFLNDMPMLNRQEIALLFFSLFIHSILIPTFSTPKRKLFILIFGFGIVISHYSTSYITLGLLLLTYSLNVGFRLLYMLRKKIFLKKLPKPSVTLTLPIVIFYIISVFLWNAQVNNTFDAPIHVLQNTLSRLSTLYLEENRSSDTAYSLFLPNNKSLVKSFQEFQTIQGQTTTDSRRLIPRNKLSEFRTRIMAPPITPLTGIGQKIRDLGINIYITHVSLRQYVAKGTQILILFGFVSILLKTRKITFFSSEAFMMMITLVILTISIVVFPTLSIEYGLLRFFQQSLILLALPLVLGSYYSGLFGKLKMFAPTLILAIFFLIMTGLLPQVTGGFGGFLQLNNSGDYYNRFYFSEGELRSFTWFTIQSKRDYVLQYTNSPAYLFEKKNLNFGKKTPLLPNMIEKNSYIYLTNSNILHNIYYVFYSGDTLPYSFDTEKLYSYKNMIYSNEKSSILK